ncbi:MAG: bile acid:sodium symporter family protein [Micropruina sp.]
MTWLRGLDRFLLAIVAAAAIATVLPAQGAWIGALHLATTAAVSLLFFLYGARLPADQALNGLRHWRLHLVILSFTYLVFPVIGTLLRPVSPALLDPALYAGLLFLCLVPSTVQSSINFTSMARGNVAGAIVSASVSNLLGVFLTPLLCWLLMTTSAGLVIHADTVLNLMGQLLLPFLLGQVSRRWTGPWVARHPRLKLLDHASIVLIVYAAFSDGVRKGVWQRISALDLLSVSVICVAILLLLLWLTRRVAERLGFERGDMIAIQMCGTKKSLATGLPMASVIFAGQDVGLLILPLMVFHQAQLIACGWLASRYARDGESSVA